MASTTQLAVEALLAAQEASPERVVDLAYHLSDERGTVILQVGGRYDRNRHRYLEDEPAVSVGGPHSGCELNQSQVEPVRAFAWFLERYLIYRRARAAGLEHAQAYALAYNDDEVALFTLHFYGGRRGGKSHLGCLLAILFAIAVPGARVILASPSLRRTQELKAAVERVTPSAWREWKSASQMFELINQSTVEMHTTGTGELKIGACDLVLVNEAQECHAEAVMDLDGNTIDMGGLLIYAYNPPRTARGTWIRDKYRQVRAGLDHHSEAFHFDPERNRFINLTALRAKAKGWGRLRYRREFLGDMDAPYDDVVFPEFSLQDHVRDRVQHTWRDVTEDRTLRFFGHRARFVGGLDFDARKGCSWVWGKIYETAEGSELLYLLGGVRKQLPRENALDAELLAIRDEHGDLIFNGDRNAIVWVCDASAKKYSTESRTDKTIPTSWERLARQRWNLCTPIESYDNNPPPETRYDLAREKLDALAVIVHGAAVELITAIQEWPIHKRSGEPMESDDSSHLNDCWTYVLFRRWYERSESAVKGTGRAERFKRRSNILS